ncbi:MAG TPA: zinc-ribbon domain-containing protein [Candidatus Ozemobacteraceae bacterium]|nr:zinc-ribbon domain-containing protein [Candidatus Ozemobacteraceae bacterium]
MSTQTNPGTCPQCSARLPEGVLFCTRCGKALETTPTADTEELLVEETSEAPSGSTEPSTLHPTVQSAPESSPSPFSLLQKEIEFLDQQYPWNLISLACVWAFLFLTYFV